MQGRDGSGRVNTGNILDEREGTERVPVPGRGNSMLHCATPLTMACLASLHYTELHHRHMAK
eukprot:scaffold69695_cov17-Tisochrysis_lutea.AAC.2